MTHTIPRYPPTYRAGESWLILDAARQGQSLCFVGIAGIGKSNITNFLRRAFSAPRKRVQWLTKEHQVMFILDDFDKVLQTGPPSLLEQLSALRNAGNRNKLSYLLQAPQRPAAEQQCTA